MKSNLKSIGLFLSAAFVLAGCGGSTSSSSPASSLDANSSESQPASVSQEDSIVSEAITYHSITLPTLPEGLSLALMQRFGTGDDMVVEEVENNKVKDGWMLMGTFDNASEKEYEFAVKMGGTEIEQFLGNEISAKTSEENGYGAFTVLAVTSDVEIAISEAPIKYTVTVNNGAAEANTDYAVNGLHVYIPEGDMDDFPDGDTRVKDGTVLKVYVYNCASDVRLTITVGEETTVKDYAEMTAFVDDDKVEILEFTVHSDISIVTSVIEIEEEPTLYNVTVDNLPDGVFLTLMQRFGTGDDMVVEQVENNKVKSGWMLMGTFENSTDVEYDFTVKMGGTEVEQVLGNTIAASDVGGNGYGAFSIPAISGDVTIEVVGPESYSVTIESGTYFNVYDGLTLLENGDTIQKGAHSFSIFLKEGTEYEFEPEDLDYFEISLTIGDQDPLTSSVIPTKYSSVDFNNVNVDGDVLISFTII